MSGRIVESLRRHLGGASPRRRRGVAAFAAGLAVQFALVGVAAASPAGASGPSGAARAGVRVVGVSAASSGPLAHAWAKGRGVSPSWVKGVRPGSVHVATIASTGAQWAVASFEAASGVPAPEQVDFQDGAATGIFTRSSTSQPWTFVEPGVEPLSCDTVLPAAVRAAWGLAPALDCGGSSSASAAAARRQLSTATGVGERIAALALSQVGESDVPTSTNFGMDCDPYTTMDGPLFPDPDVRGCGFDSHFGVADESEEWCADFAEWVWRQAGVTADMNLINPGANSFYDWGVAQGQTLTVDGTDPQVGDAVVFYEPGTITASTGADHVGIVTGVNSNGTVNLVDGDFLGTTNIGVQYNTDVDLNTWASEVWSPGEQWVFVSPPTSAQLPDPAVTVSGPHIVAADTETTWHTSGHQIGGSITTYAWAFGDGEYVPGGAEDGTVVHHVFADPGRVTVTMIATSSLGTIAVKTWNVEVVTPASTVASTPSDALYYAYTPVEQRLFTVGPTGVLTEQSWDGASWLDEPISGSWTDDSPVASLDYKDRDDALTPHVFGRSADGALQETELNGATWTTETLAGSPAQGSPIVATNVVPDSPAGAVGSAQAYAAVFFFDAAGRLVESSDADGSWRSSNVPGVTGARGLAVGTTTIAGRPAITLYTVAADDRLVAVTQTGPIWSVRTVGNRLGLASGTPLAAVNSGGTGDPAVFFVDRTGHLAEASPGWLDLTWSAQQISNQSTNLAAGLQADNDVTGAGVVPEVAAVSPSGTAQLVTDIDGTWSTENLPGSATTLLGLAAYPVPGGPQTLLLSGSQGMEADTAATGTGPWTATSLPSKPATFADRVLLYGADSADYKAAVTAAATAGLAPSQATGDFATAWADTLSGDYLVISVGGPATSALYYNVCGWANPSDAFAGSTPFSYVLGPLDALPRADLFEQANGSTGADSAALAKDLAYYAVSGTLPAGVTSLPTQVGPDFACSGSPSAS